MYDDLHAERNLGQLHIVISPNFSSSSGLSRQHLSQAMRELNAIIPAPGFSQIYYPEQDQDTKQRKATVEDVETVDDIYQYLISDALYNTSHETRSPFTQQLLRQDFLVVTHFRQAIEETLPWSSSFGVDPAGGTTRSFYSPEWLETCFLYTSLSP